MPQVMQNLVLEDIINNNQQETDSVKKADNLMLCAQIYRNTKDYDCAIKAVEEAQKIYSKINNINETIKCLLELALLNYKKYPDRIIRALTLINDAKYLIETTPSSDKKELTAMLLHYNGIIEFQENHQTEALELFKKAEELIIQKDTCEYAKLLDDFALYNLRQKKYQVAEKQLISSIKIKKAHEKNPFQIAKTAVMLGRYFANIENNEEAIEYLNMALEAAECFNDNALKSRIYDEIANVYLSMKDTTNAMVFHQKALAEFNDKMNPKLRAYNCCTQIELFIIEKKYNEAMNILKQDIEPFFTTDREHAITYRLYGKIYGCLKDYEKSLQYLHQAIELYKKIDNNIELIKCYTDLSDVYRASDNHQMALSSLEEALEVAKIYDLQILAQKIEDLIFETDKDEWANIINKNSNKEQSSSEDMAFLETMNLLGSLTQSDITYKDSLFALLRIGRFISAATNIDELLERIAEETKIALDAERCTIFMYDKEKNELYSKIALGIESKELRFPANKGLAGYVATTGETVNIRNAYEDDRFNKEIDKQTGYKTKTILCMPFRNINHEIVGVFQMLGKKGDKIFSEKDEDLLLTIGSNAGIALENARLFEEQKMLLEEQKKSLISFIDTLAASIDARDSITAGHSNRVRLYSKAIAEEMNLPQEKIELIEYSAILHDIGKIGVQDNVLFKQGKLTEEEYAHIQQHVRITHDILEKMYFQKSMKDVPVIAASHHEKFDGTGYYQGLKGEEIPLGGRILAIADVFDAITSERYYRSRMPIYEALNLFKKNRGSHFDPALVDVFFSLSLDKILDILLSAYNISLKTEQGEYFSKYSIKNLYDAMTKKADQRSVIENLLIENFDKLYTLSEK